MNQSRMKVSKDITIGNLVSWSLILIGFVAGFATLKGNTAKALEVANEAKITADSSKDAISSLRTDIAVIKVTTQNIEKSLDEIKAKL